MKKVLVSLLVFFFVALLVLAYTAREFFLPAESENKTIRMVIPSGMPASEVGSLLADDDVVRHAWSFNLLMRLTNTGTRIVAGAYDLSPSQSEYEILDTLIKGRSVLARVIIPEGFNLRQIAELLDSKGVVSRDDFLEAARGKRISIPEAGLDTQGAEGFLFPDTYDLEPRVSAQAAMQPMLDRFKELVVPLYLKAGNPLTLRQIVILASMVEKEGKDTKEFPLISSVYYNRLQQDMPLQCDATVQYLLPDPKEFLAADDLKIDSPYNTYLHAGLPPGPIANPGLAAVKAALRPAHTSYLYYVLGGPGGRHVFSATYAGQMRAVEHYNHWIRSRSKP